MFFPVEGARVSVLETAQQIPYFSSTQCLDCKAKWEGSQLMDVMRNTKWEQLEEIVSVFQQS